MRDTSKTPGSRLLGGSVRVVGSGLKGIVDTVEDVLGVDALIALNVRNVGRGADSVKGVGGELAGCYSARAQSGYASSAQ